MPYFPSQPCLACVPQCTDAFQSQDSLGQLIRRRHNEEEVSASAAPDGTAVAY
jgi:hypothetical protein